MIPLTRRQSELLQFLRDADLCPTYQQMADHLGVSSKSTVTRVLEGLEERGFIRRSFARHQAVELVEREALAAFSTEALRSELRRREAIPDPAATPAPTSIPAHDAGDRRPPHGAAPTNLTKGIP